MNIRKRRIGLALGSGAARGWAHIGVIQALAEQGIEPDIITGSSVGAIVGGALAGGTLDAFESWIRKLSRIDIIRLMDARLRGGGFLQGKILMRNLEKKLGNPDIQTLPLHFGCIATELGTGREVWLREGPLLEACRASIALPGLFAPARQGSDYLVDGGLVNPVPVSLARAMGADIVIAVNLNGDLVGQHFWAHQQAIAADSASPAPEKSQDSPQGDENPLLTRLSTGLKSGIGVQLDAYISSLRKKESPDPGLFDVIVGAVDIMQDRITRSRMAGEPPDLHLTPRVSHVGLMEFDRADETIAAGRDSVARQSEEVGRLAELIRNHRLLLDQDT